MPRAGRRSAPPTPRSSSRCARSASSTSCSTRASTSSPPWSRAARRWPATGSRVEADLRIARGLDYYTGTVFETRMDGFERLDSICSGGRYDALATDGRTTYPGVGISLGVTPDRWCRCSAAACSTGSRAGARAPCWSRSPTRSRRAASDAIAARAARPRHPRRGRRQRRRSSASRSGTPSGAASRSSGSRGRRRPRGQGHPQRASRSAADPATWTPPERRPATRRSIQQPRGARTSDPHPRRRRPARRARRPDRHPRRLGGPPPRPRRRRLHRPARGQRRRPGRDPRRGGRAPACAASTA